jgi:hypothetical protein
MKHTLALMLLVGAAAILTVTAWGQTGAAAPSSDTRHPLTKALDNKDNLLLVANLQPTNQQILDLLEAARSARAVVNDYDTTLNQATLDAAPLFRMQLNTFQNGILMDEKSLAALNAYHQQRRQLHTKLLVGVEVLVRQVRHSLGPDQVSLIDWTRPPEAAPPLDNRALLEEMRKLNADLGDATRLLERLRYLVASDYVTSRIGRINDYLRQYVRPNTPEFDEARDWMLGLVDQVRQVPENQWPQQSSLYAGRLMQYLGVLEPDNAQPAQTRWDWWDVYSLLTDSQTPEMLQQMLAARGNPADGQ